MRSSPFALLDRLIAPAPAREARRLPVAASPSPIAGCTGAGVVENSRAAFPPRSRAGHGIECDVQVVARRRGVRLPRRDARPADRRDAGSVAERTAADARPRSRLPGTGERLPRLAEMLQLVAGRVPILIEVKAQARRIVAAVPVGAPRAGGLSRAGGGDVVQSAGRRTGSRRMRRASSRGLVVSEQDKPRPCAGAIERRLSLWRARPDFLAYDVRDLPSRFAAAARARGLPVLTWTVRDAAAERDRRAPCRRDHLRAAA